MAAAHTLAEDLRAPAPLLDDQLRKQSERDFHNQRFGADEDNRQHLDKWYTALAACAAEQDKRVRRWGRRASVLEYGCANGSISARSFDLGHDFAAYSGIDISDEAIAVACRNAAEAGLSNCSYEVMDAEQMTFPAASFDVVYGRGILHHLDLDRCFAEIARVLRPGGKAIFNEPLGHNPALNWYRNRTPALRTPDEHPLLIPDFDKARAVFQNVECQYYGLSTVLAVPFRNLGVGNALMKACESFDRVLLRVPYIRQNAWSVLLTLTR
jgi:SAM-dependent methyltransferase